MPNITAVELGADSCVLVRTSVRHGAISVLAVETLDPAAFPGVDAFTAAVKQTRRALKLPRRCGAVVWGLPDGANRSDIAVQPLLAPLTRAGFKVGRVLSPCNALAALARVKSVRGDGATCWLAINRGGVAIVVVRPGKQLYSYSFAWDSSVGNSGSQARLLQRYSLVAILGPEVKRAMAEARKHGIAVEAVVTCGNLPDLRSLTMPLIEELDVEVETLDSLEGLVVKPAAADRFAELAPAIRLACAGLIARGTRTWDEQRGRSVQRTGAALRFAAAAALVLGLGYAWYIRAKLPVVSAMPARATVSRPAPPEKAPWKPPTRAVTEPGPSVSGAATQAESHPNKPEPRPAAPTAVSATSTPSAASVPMKATAAVSSVGSAPKPNAAGVPTPPSVAKPASGVGTALGPASGANPAVTSPPPSAAKPTPPKSNPQEGSAAAASPKPDPVPSTKGTAPAGARSAAAVPPSNPPAGSETAKKAESTPPAGSGTAKRAESNSPAGSGAAKNAESNPPAGSGTAKRAESNPPSVAAAAARALEIATRPSASVPRAAGPVPRAADPAPRVADPAPRAADRAPRAAELAPPVGSGLNTPAVPADKPVAARNRPLPPLLKDPLPRVTTILVSSERRFATIDTGQIIGIGDVLGRRVVVAIDERTVVLREPSGVQIRVGLGGRLMAVGHSDR